MIHGYTTSQAECQAQGDAFCLESVLVSAVCLVDPPTQSLCPPERNIKASLALWLPVGLAMGKLG